MSSFERILSRDARGSWIFFESLFSTKSVVPSGRYHTPTCCDVTSGPTSTSIASGRPPGAEHHTGDDCQRDPPFQVRLHSSLLHVYESYERYDVDV